MMDRVRTFGESLTEWMSENGLTASVLAAYTRETRDATIARLMHDQLDYQRCARYITELAESFPGIDEDTLRKLRVSVDVNRYGKEMYIASMNFFRMIDSARQDQPLKDDRIESVHNRLMGWGNGQSFEVLCLGLTEKEPLQFLHTISSRKRDTHIYQFFCEAHISQLSGILARTLSLAFNPNYELYSVKDYPGVMMTNVIIIRRKDGAHLLIAFDAGEFTTLPLAPGNDLFEFMTGILLSRHHSPKKLNCHFAHNCPKAYIDFLSHCLSLEKDKAIYQIKSEIGLEYVPVDILFKNFSAWAHENDTRFLPFLEDLKDIFKNRNENLLSKKEPTYLIMTKKGMTEFVKTGRMKDHPFCLSAFTPEEIKKILSVLLSAAETSTVIPLIFSNEDMELNYSFIGYSRECMLICTAASDYDLADYTEIVLTSGELSGQFADFVVSILSKGHVLGKRAGLEFISSLMSKLTV